MNTDKWRVGNASIPYQYALLYADAKHRVLHSRAIRDFYDILLADGYVADHEHLAWICRSRVAELVGWARQIQRDSE
jgi:hypothetical protein